jgi:hypothetical protein
MIRARMFAIRMFAIACGYEDSNDLDHLRADPAFKLACGRLPSLPAGGCRTRIGICVRSRRYLAWRTHRACARSSG